MDILDIILAKSMTPQGQIDTYAAKAQKAVSDANKIVSDIEAITEQTNTNNENAQTALENAQAAAQEYQSISDNIDGKITAATADLQSDIDEAVTEVTIEDENTSSYKSKNAKVRKKGLLSSFKIMKNYLSTGNNEDGTMTQKAITEELAKISTSGTNLGGENAGNVVVIGSDGNIISSDINEEELIEALVKAGAYKAKDAVGLTIDYQEKTFIRQQEAENYIPGINFNKYPMYGGRMRCNVADDGTINAFYGQLGYKEDGSNGQVMVYQPKFYYQRRPLKMKENTVGRMVIQEAIILSATEQAGFKVHPLFKAENGDILDYVLLPAYEGSCYHVSENTYITNDAAGVDFNQDKLSSIANTKPISGANNNLTLENAEKLAKNRGTGWHITNMAAESANQMLFLVEYGTLNAQVGLELGICNLTTNSNYNYASQTGSTSALGNTTGAATSTINITGGTTTTYSTPGTRAVTYRGWENPWGNTWRFIGGTLVNGNSQQDGGILYVCDDFNYSSTITSNYHSTGFSLPTTSTWISALGYGGADYDWVLAPAEAKDGNSVLPIGDLVWVINYLNATKVVSVGGAASHGNNDGLFYYACDQNIDSVSRVQSARLMYIPDKTKSNYLTNYNAWRSIIGG